MAAAITVATIGLTGSVVTLLTANLATGILFGVFALVLLVAIVAGVATWRHRSRVDEVWLAQAGTHSLASVPRGGSE